MASILASAYTIRLLPKVAEGELAAVTLQATELRSGRTITAHLSAFGASALLETIFTGEREPINNCMDKLKSNQELDLTGASPGDKLVIQATDLIRLGLDPNLFS